MLIFIRFISDNMFIVKDNEKTQCVTLKAYVPRGPTHSDIDYNIISKENLEEIKSLENGDKIYLEPIINGEDGVFTYVIKSSKLATHRPDGPTARIITSCIID